MKDLDYIQKFKADDPLRKVSNVQDHNRIANILNTIAMFGEEIWSMNIKILFDF